MATIEDLATRYAGRLRGAPDKDAEIEKIAEAIDSLRYDDGSGRISSNDKQRLIRLMYEELIVEPRTVDRDGRTWIQKEADNKRYLLLVQSLQALLVD